MFHAELRLLRCLSVISEEGSVTRAAERLNLTQPTVSGQLRDLETQLGFSLFIRSTRSITPTPELLQLLPLVQAVTEATEHLQGAVEAMQQERSMHFRMGAAMYSLDFDERLALTDAFNSYDPGIRFLIDNRLQHQQVKDLLDGQLDIAFLLGIPVKKLDLDPGPGLIANEVQFPQMLERIVLASRRVGLMVPEELDIAQGEGPIAPASLHGRKIAMLSMEHGSAFIEPIAQFLRDVGAELVSPPEGNALAVERYAARQGICGLETGWFPPLKGQVFRHVEGLESRVDFSLVLGTSPAEAAKRFFRFAKRWASEQLKAAA